MTDRLLGPLGRIAGTFALEIRLNLMSPGPWVVGLALSLLGYLQVRTAADPNSFRLGWILASDIGPFSVVLLLFLAASFAFRPWRYELTELQDSKRAGSEEVLVGRWGGMVVGILIPLLLEYGVTLLGQRVHSKAPVVLAAYADSLWRLLPPVLFFTTLSFGLVSLTGILVLGAGLAGLAWTVLLFGRELLPNALWMDLAQNGPMFLGLAATTLLALLLVYRSHRRARRTAIGRVLKLGAGLMLAATVLRAVWVDRALPGRGTAVRTWQRLRTPGLARGGPRGGPTAQEPIANFAWTDVRGRRVSLADFRGRPALLVLVQPQDNELLSLLSRLTALRRQFPPERLGLLTLCLSEDLEIAHQAARMAGDAAARELPLATDWGRPTTTFFFDDRRPSSVVSFFLRVRTTPTALLLDRAGRETTRDLSLDAANWQDLIVRLRAVLEEEKQPLGAP